MFVSLVGAFACIPLAFIYPALIHRKLVACGAAEVWKDNIYVVCGIALPGFVGAMAIKNIVQGSVPEPMACEPHSGDLLDASWRAVCALRDLLLP